MVSTSKRSFNKAYVFVLRDILLDFDYRSIRNIILWKQAWQTRKSITETIKDRWKFCVACISVLGLIRINGSKNIANSIRFIEPSNQDRQVRSRKYYLLTHLHSDASQLHWKSDLYINSWKDLIALLRTYGRLLSVLTRIDLAQLSVMPIWKFFMYLLAIELNNPKEIFLFDFHQIEIYLLSRFLSTRTNISVIYIPTNSRLYSQFRYGAYQNLSLIFSSPPQIEEVESYEDIGWLKLDGVTLRCVPHLFSEHLDAMDRTLKYDLVLYSSGDWARKDGCRLSHGFDRIGAMEYINNERYVLFLSVLRTLLKAAQEFSLRFVVRAHPYEVFLLSKHGVNPPYLSEVLEYGANVVLNESNSNIFDAELGVVTDSSILYDRLSFGLKTFFYIPSEPIKKRRGTYYNPRFAPSLAVMGFCSDLELYEKIRINVTNKRDCVN